VGVRSLIVPGGCFTLETLIAMAGHLLRKFANFRAQSATASNSHER